MPLEDLHKADIRVYIMHGTECHIIPSCYSPRSPLLVQIPNLLVGLMIIIVRHHLVGEDQRRTRENITESDSHNCPRLQR